MTLPMNRLHVCLIALAVATPTAATAQEFADESFADESEVASDLQVSLAGTVTSFHWTEPQCRVVLLVALPNGRDVSWQLQLAAPDELEARGWKPSSLKPGTKVQLDVTPSMDGSTSGEVVAARRSNGKPIGRTAEI
jgi:hypothetical protein